MRKRINNDFDALVEVLHEGVKIDLSLYEITGVRMVSNQTYLVTDYKIQNGSLFLHVTHLIVPRCGRYKIIVTYRMADSTLADGFWNFEFDKYLVTIVGSSEEEDAGDVVITADAVIGMQGKSAYEVWLDTGNTGTREDFLADIKGDPFRYEDFTPEQIEALKVKGDAFEYSDFTPEQIAELQGASAYQIWLSLGNNGTEQDFINSLAAGGIDLSSYLTELEASGLYQPIGAYLTAETDPTVPDWAKAATKPTYTAAEVGASEFNHTHTDIHTHSNKTVLDATTASFTTAYESKLDGLSNYTHPATHSIAEVSGLQTALDGKVDDGQVLTNVPSGALFTDTVYTHPATHEATIITQDATHRFVTDTEKMTWNSKADTSHTHDDRYYTESEVNALLQAKKGAYNAEIVTSPTTGTLTLKNSTETVLDGSLTSSNTFTVALPTATAGQVNESILIFKIGASLPTITQPTGIVWRGATPTLAIYTNWTIVYEQVNTTGTTYEIWAVATKNA